MPLLPVVDLEDARLAPYRNVKDGELLRRDGLFVVEGRFAVRTLLERSAFRVRSLLSTENTVATLQDVLDLERTDVFVASRQCIEGLLDFRFHQGCLALGQRESALSPQAVTDAAGAGPILLLEDLANADNVGGIFRSALALGAQGVLLSPSCCDPLYRKAVRGSIGASLVLPHSRLPGWPQQLEQIRQAGWRLVGLTPADDAQPLTAAVAGVEPDQRVALLLGNEGRGLSAAALACCDERWRIEMAPDVDSVNVVTAAGIALHQLYCRRSGRG